MLKGESCCSTISGMCSCLIATMLVVLLVGQRLLCNFFFNLFFLITMFSLHMASPWNAKLVLVFNHWPCTNSWSFQYIKGTLRGSTKSNYTDKFFYENAVVVNFTIIYLLLKKRIKVTVLFNIAPKLQLLNVNVKSQISMLFFFFFWSLRLNKLPDTCSVRSLWLPLSTV